MPKGRVLVVDSDESASQSAAQGLADNGYEVSTASSGADGVAKAGAEKPDLIILDADLPGMDGYETCREIRRNVLAPIIMLGARAEESDVALGLGMGADYYLAKPVGIRALLAHVEAAMRRENGYRREQVEPNQINVKDLIVDLAAYELRRNGEIIPLTTTEFKLVHSLARNAGRILTRNQLLDSVWELKADGVYSRTVDVHIARIRRKMGDDPIAQRYIKTVTGIGYKMAGA